MAPRRVRRVGNVIYVVFAGLRPRRAVSRREVLRMIRWARWGTGDCA